MVALQFKANALQSVARPPLPSVWRRESGRERRTCSSGIGDLWLKGGDLKLGCVNIHLAPQALFLFFVAAKQKLNIFDFILSRP